MERASTLSERNVCTERPEREGRGGRAGHVCYPAWPRSEVTSPGGWERTATEAGFRFMLHRFTDSSKSERKLLFL